MRLGTLLLLGLAASTSTVGSTPLAAQQAPTVTVRGLVRDAAGRPIAGARVSAADRSTTTGADGRFLLDALPGAATVLEVRAVGFAPRTVRLAPGSPVDIQLQARASALPQVEVVAGPVAGGSPPGTDVLSGDALRLAQAPSLGETLAQLPGVRSLGTGPGIGKPVLRGLTGSQVAVVANGQRLESQQWGLDHAPNVETADLERIEVLRGAAAIEFGTDALGGVVRAVAPTVPAPEDAPFRVRGRVGAAYADNARAPEGSLRIDGGDAHVGFRAAVTVREAGDYRAPQTDGSVFGGRRVNSGLGTRTASAAFGVRGAWGAVTASGTLRNERLEIHEADPTATPFQRIGDLRLALEGEFATRLGRLEVATSTQRNRRREFDAAEATDVTLGFRETTDAATVRLRHAPIGALTGTVGVAANVGTVAVLPSLTALIPNSRTVQLGVFATERLAVGRLALVGGLRLDHRTLLRRPTPELGLAGEDRRSWTSLTGAVGGTLPVGRGLEVAVDLTRGYRPPTPFQLYVNGVHEGTGFFEIGDSTLRAERSLAADATLRLDRGRVRAELTGFVHAIDDYIAIAPTGADFTDPTSGEVSPIYRTVQTDARLRGAEATVEVRAASWLELQATADVVRSTDRLLGGPIPFTAPGRAALRAVWRGRDGRVLRPYVSLGAEHHAAQRRTVPFDQPSDAYTLVDAAAGLALPTARGLVRIDLQATNLFDVAALPFLSRYKTYAFAPGRSLVLRLAADL